MSTLIDRWKRRYWQADNDAIAALSGERPAVVVTGGSEGIGLALAKTFAATDRTVLLISRDSGKLDRARTELENRGHRAILTLPMDLCTSESPARIREFLSNHDCYTDILINSAGIGAAGNFVANDPDELTRLTELNMTALTRLCRAFLPDMLTRGRGGIINVSSLGGFAPGPYQAAYYASKAYVISFTRALAHETRGHGIRIATVAPGPVETLFHARMDGQNAL